LECLFLSCLESGLETKIGLETQEIPRISSWS